MNCPRCNSNNTYKRGIRGGNQRYSCKDCGASFTENVMYVAAPIYKDPVAIHCPRGEGHRIVRDGKLAGGSQRYKCETCGLYFSTKTNMNTVAEIEWDCPYCGGRLFYSGYSKTGAHKYRCTQCKKTCTADENRVPIKREPPFHETNTTIPCAYCGSYNLNKAGSKNNNPRYICRDCGRAFFKKQKLPEESIISAVLSGKNIEKLCTKYDYTSEEIKEIMKPYYSKETITDTQRNDIIKYGYYLRVPVDYMAEYIGCSEHACLKVINKYKKNIRSTSFGAI